MRGREALLEQMSLESAVEDNSDVLTAVACRNQTEASLLFATISKLTHSFCFTPVKKIYIRSLSSLVYGLISNQFAWISLTTNTFIINLHEQSLLWWCSQADVFILQLSLSRQFISELLICNQNRMRFYCHQEKKKTVTFCDVMWLSSDLQKMPRCAEARTRTHTAHHPVRELSCKTDKYLGSGLLKQSGVLWPN